MSEQRPGGLSPEEYRRLYERQRKESGADVILDTDDTEDWRRIMRERSGERPPVQDPEDESAP